MSSEKKNIFGESSNESSKENFEPIKSGNTGLKLFLIFIILGLLSFSVYYFFFKKDNRSKEEDLIASNIAEEFTESQTLPSENEVEVEKFESLAPQKPEIVHVTKKTQSYYIVIGSFVDKYLAEDLCKDLLKKNKGSYIIHPDANSIYYVVGVSKFDTLQEAEKNMEEVRKEYRTSVWIKKF